MYKKVFWEAKMNEKITLQICERSIGGEINAEISMPDYEPEIRRILRVGVTLTPPALLFDGTRVGMRGDAIFDLLYAGNDGELYSTRTTESYELAEALKPSERENVVLSAICRVTPESLVTKAVAPRKLTVKCKLRGNGRFFGEQEVGERVEYEEAGIEKLFKQAEFAHILPSSFAEVKLSDDFSSGVASDSLRVVNYTAFALCESAEPSGGEAAIRGTLDLRLLLSNDDGSAPISLTRRIPFYETVECDGLDQAAKCTASASCVACNFSIDGGRIFCEPTLIIRLDAEQNRAVEYVADAYSTEVSTSVTEKHLEFPVLEKLFCGNFTLNVRQSAEESGIADGTDIIDTTSVAVVNNIEHNGEKSAIVGEVCLNILGICDGEHITKEIRAPFKYELEVGKSPVSFADCGVISVPSSARIDGGRFSCDCELHFCGSFHSKSAFEAVDRVTFGEKIEKEDIVTVCFPSSTDTVWEVAKRYHIPTDIIISQEDNIKNQEAVVF